ncbi:hypothetical protein NDU88_005549 [Pleurodeles waltl]|uniref:Uncharacterized protein n=1 Tax=Pleurodeles waltl TaxID=8319 RepID=A0AAV7LN62_PLEWA|nr:hypothetical protein NDU88_005549 [Pleurodeles waltl]
MSRYPLGPHDRGPRHIGDEEQPTHGSAANRGAQRVPPGGYFQTMTVPRGRWAHRPTGVLVELSSGPLAVAVLLEG